MVQVLCQCQPARDKIAPGRGGRGQKTTPGHVDEARHRGAASDHTGEPPAPGSRAAPAVLAYAELHARDNNRPGWARYSPGASMRGSKFIAGK